MITHRFFITGLPRSRTSWLANLLTFGRSFCLHEGLAAEGDIACLSARLDKLAERMPGVAIGDSDSILPLQAEAFYQTFSGAPLVIVNRPAEDVMTSLAAFQRDNRYTGFPMRTELEIRQSLHAIQTGLEYLRLRWPREQLLEVNYGDLNSLPVCQLIADHCAAGTADRMSAARCFEDRWALLNQLRVNPIAEKYFIHPKLTQPKERILSWA